MGFIPVGDLMRELVLALGAAMVAGSVAVLVRERRRKRADRKLEPKPNMRVVVLNIVLGLVLTGWGLSSIIAAR